VYCVQPGADHRPRARLVVVLGALSAFGPLSVDLYLPGLPKLTADFHAAASAGQLTLTACVVGLALGQLGFGPLSDRLGRRPPLVAGLVVYAAASLACALAPSIWVLVGLRLVQGLAGAAGIVVARSIVRDLVAGPAAAQLFSILMVVVGVVPIVAPIAGGQLLQVMSWRGLYAILAAVAAAILVSAFAWVPETLPRERRARRGEGIGFGELWHDRLFVAYAVVLGLSFASMFTYIAGSSFVLQDLYGVSAQLYGGVFGLNAAGLIVCSELNRKLVRRVGPRRLLGAGVAAQAAAGAVLLAVVLAGVGLAGILPCLFVVVSMLGFVVPNATALAMTDYPHAAGRASALLGAGQFLLGGLAAPLVGLAGRDTAVPMAVLIAVFGSGGLVAALSARRVQPALLTEMHAKR
jgi:DHA1 family bicyclomycin/chloramphenicol resistance-like MFS transporter